jgi:alkylhydroperoxidase family enzyme
MADLRARIAPVDVEKVPDDIKAAFEGQTKLWGEPLHPYLFYAHAPGFFRAAQGMWSAVHGAKRVPATLKALLNRRVAWWNGCEF